jgi:hypothetical protein
MTMDKNTKILTIICFKKNNIKLMLKVNPVKMKKYRVKMMKMKILMKIINQMISIQIAE